MQQAKFLDQTALHVYGLQRVKISCQNMQLASAHTGCADDLHVHILGKWQHVGFHDFGLLVARTETTRRPNMMLKSSSYMHIV